MEPQRNIELSNVENSGFSNNQFEDLNFESQQNFEAQNPEQGIDVDKSREAVFSTFDKFSVRGENLQAQPGGQVLPPIQDFSNEQVQAAPSVPATAQDIDLMEDEWVKDLKKMIVETKNDPYMREVRFKEMQMDYLKKRYNRIINGGK